MMRKKVSWNITIFYIYRVVSRMYFHLTVLFLHFYMSGFGLGLTIALLATYGLITTVTANLGNWLSPILGLKQLVALGEFMKSIGLVLVVLGTRVGGVDFWTVMAGQIIGGAGFSLAISSDGSLLRSITQAAGNEQFGRIQSRSQSFMFLSTLVAGCAGSILYDYEAHWPFFASLGATLIASSAILLIRSESPAAPAPTAAALPGARLDLNDNQKFWMNFYSMSRAYTLGPFVGFLPFYFIELQVDPYLFGAVLGLFSVGAFITALYANSLLKNFGLHSLMITTLACMLGSMVLFGFNDLLAIRGIDYFTTGLLAVALLGIGSGGVSPVTMANIDLGSLAPEQRPRALLLMERNFGLFNGMMLGVGWYLLKTYGFSTVMLALALSYVAVMTFLLLSSRVAFSRPKV